MTSVNASFFSAIFIVIPLKENQPQIKGTVVSLLSICSKYLSIHKYWDDSSRDHLQNGDVRLSLAKMSNFKSFKLGPIGSMRLSWINLYLISLFGLPIFGATVSDRQSRWCLSLQSCRSHNLKWMKELQHFGPLILKVPYMDARKQENKLGVCTS